MLADLPLATPEAIAALARRFDELPPEKTLLAPCRDGVFGHPMFYRAVWRERFRSAQGDAGGRKIVALYESEIERVAGRRGRPQNRRALRIRNRTRRRPRLPLQRHGHAGRLR